MKNKILARVLLILSSLAVTLESCYLFCLFRPENGFEEIMDQFVEDEMEEGIFDEDLLDDDLVIFSEKDF